MVPDLTSDQRRTADSSEMIFGNRKNWEERYDADYVARSNRPRRATGRGLWIHGLGGLLVVSLMLAFVGIVGGQASFEKTVTALVTPLGIAWMLLMGLVYSGLLLRQVWSASLAFVIWSLLTVFGNRFVANQLLFSLEGPHLSFAVEDLERLDVVFLLGGGTATDISGQARAADAGDRVVTAARLFHAGKVGLIVCSGVQLFRTDPLDLNPNQEAAQLLADLNVPGSSIAMIHGRNTAEEMRLAAHFLQQQALPQARVGIITSASHLDRAGRLARANGFSPVLIPANVKSSFFTGGPHYVIPSANSLEESARCIKECLAGWINR